MVQLNTRPPLPDVELARITTRHWPRHLWVDALALVWPESGGRPDAAGDALHQFSADQQAAWRAYSCQGFTSIGLWQVHMPSHKVRLERLSGRSAPCDWAEWLVNPDNCARAAVEIAEDRIRAKLPPLSAWTAWNTGASARWRQRAIDALAAAGILPTTSDAPVTVTEYVVQPGDTLYGIAGRVLGDSSRWPDIYAANRDIIGQSPDVIHPGMRLRIPGAPASPATEPPAPPSPTQSTPPSQTPADALLSRLERLIARLEDLISRLPQS